MIEFFGRLSFSRKLVWNKKHEENNSKREQNRILAQQNLAEATSDSENESLFSYDEEDLVLLEDPSVFKSYKEIIPPLLRLSLASQKRK